MVRANKIKLGVLSILILLTYILIAQESKFIIVGGDQNDFGLSILERLNDNNKEEYFVGGSTRSFGSGSSDYYLLKFNDSLELINESFFGGPNADLFRSMTIGFDDNILLFGSSFDFKIGGQNFNITSVDSSGNFIDRNVIYNRSTDIGYKIFKTSDGNLGLFGLAESNDPFGQGKLQILDSKEEVLLEKEYGESGVRDYGFDAFENNRGYVVLTNNNCEIGMSARFPGFRGSTGVKVTQTNKNGSIIWEYEYDGTDHDYAFSMVQLNNHIYVAINTRSSSTQSFDIKILKLNLNGILIGSFQFGGESFEYANKIIADSNGDLIICGTSASGVRRPSFYAFKISEYGDLIWERKIEEEASIYANDVVERSSNGNLLFTGKYTVNYNNDDVFLLELNSEGESTSFQEEGISEVRLFPNPTNAFVNILAKNIDEIEEVNIFTMQGQNILTINSGNKKRIDLSSQRNGTYLLDIIDSNGKHYREKVILMK